MLVFASFWDVTRCVTSQKTDRMVFNEVVSPSLITGVIYVAINTGLKETFIA